MINQCTINYTTQWTKHVQWIFPLLIWLVVSPALAVENDPAKNISQLELKLNEYQNRLKNPDLAESELFQLVKELSETNNATTSKITDIEENTKKLKGQVASLGEAIAGESSDVKNKRKALQDEKTKFDKWLAQYRLLLLRSEELLNESKQRLNDLLAAKLLHKSPSIVALAGYVIEHANDMLSIYADYVIQHMGFTAISATEYLFLTFFVTVALIIGFWLKKRILRWSFSNPWDNKFVSTLFETFILSTARFLPYLLVSAVLLFIFHNILSTIEPLPLIALIAYALPVYIFTLYIIHMFIAPKLPARSFLHLPEKVGRRMGYKFNILAVITFTGYILLGTLHLQKAPQNILIFWREVFVLLGVINLIWIVIYSKQIPQIRDRSMPRMLIVLSLLGMLALELFGYRNLVFTIAGTLSAVLVGFVIVTLLHHISKDFYDGLDTGAKPWHKAIRSKLGLKSRQPMPGLTFVRLVTLFVLWGGFVLFTISLLDFSGVIRQSISTFLVQGINLGDLNINPTRILLAIIVFSLMFALSSWIKTQMERQWLARSRIDRGAKDALVTISGYIGVALALLIALNIAGVTFTNFAIIAGALSVGIGFGLQNIVNNFVSGLILLFERPIKNGDWIIVGSTEGHVKKISIRSTQIQTFDRADIIVPNSELVSTQVTNWMLHDKIGRVRIPVGVAYGSDTEKVRQILNDVAMAHPKVIKDSPNYKTSIFFLRFGDSSLDFELRCFIDDMDNALTVKSDLNFAVDKAFRENGVEIPFPQRDIHVRSTVDSSSSKELSKSGKKSDESD
jgi:potassium efflux system protein